MGIFDKTVATQLRIVGDEWNTTLNGGSLSFYAVFDAENQIEDDGTGMIATRPGNALTCLTSVARQFDTPTKTLTSLGQLVTAPDGTHYRVQEVLKIEDGALSKCTLVEVEE